jgi:hypothetical protein
MGLMLAGCMAAGRASSAAVGPLPPGCDPDDPLNIPTACGYESDLQFTPTVLPVVPVLTDPARDDYEVPVRIRFPHGAVGPRPIVVWHHGGEPRENGHDDSSEWGEALAGAGYVVVHPGRTPLPRSKLTPALLRECRDNGVLRGCANFIAQRIYGPQKTQFVIGRLAGIAAVHPVLNGLLDFTRIAVAGHSAGTTVVLSNAGAWTQYDEDGPVYGFPFAAADAFMATGPQGPAYAGFSSGFQEDSYFGIDRPFLFMTGKGDETGEPSEARTAGWITSQPGNKFLSWDTEPEAEHETMNNHLCDTALREQHCGWIEMLGVAYMDAMLRGRVEAIAWLESDASEVLSGGAIELHAR